MNPLIKEEDTQNLSFISARLNHSKKTIEYHHRGITKVKYYDVKSVERSLALIRKLYPSNQVEIIKKTHHRYRPGTEATVVLILDYNLKFN